MDAPKTTQRFIVEDIKANDVLFGRGPFCYRFPGNVAFRNLIKSHIETYQRCAPRSIKQKIVKNLISKAQKQGLRFLILDQSSGMWCEAHPHSVRSKVSHALRDARNLVVNECDKISSSEKIARNGSRKEAKSNAKRQEAKSNDLKGHNSFNIDFTDCKSLQDFHQRFYGRRNEIPPIEHIMTHFYNVHESALCQAKPQLLDSKNSECVQTTSFCAPKFRYVLRND
jgi:hypothetical protein